MLASPLYGLGLKSDIGLQICLQVKSCHTVLSMPVPVEILSESTLPAAEIARLNLILATHNRAVISGKAPTSRLAAHVFALKRRLQSSSCTKENGVHQLLQNRTV